MYCTRIGHACTRAQVQTADNRRDTGKIRLIHAIAHAAISKRVSKQQALCGPVPAVDFDALFFNEQRREERRGKGLRSCGERVLALQVNDVSLFCALSQCATSPQQPSFFHLRALSSLSHYWPTAICIASPSTRPVRIPAAGCLLCPEKRSILINNRHRPPGSWTPACARLHGSYDSNCPAHRPALIPAERIGRFSSLVHIPSSAQSFNHFPELALHLAALKPRVCCSNCSILCDLEPCRLSKSH